MKSSQWAVWLAVAGLVVGCGRDRDAPATTAPPQQLGVEASRLRSQPATSGSDETEPAIAGIPLSDWVERLHSDNVRVRANACRDLGQLGEEAKAAIPALIDCLGRMELVPRALFVKTLADIGPSAVPALIEALNGDDERVRSAAAVALGQIGPDAKDAVPALRAALGPGLLGQNSARALGRIGPHGMPALIDALKNGSEHAALALGEIGPDAREAVPALLAAIKSGQEDVSRSAAEALRKIDPEAARRAGVE